MTIKGAKGEQLRMFMTPNEIHADYTMLDGDRGEWNDGTPVEDRQAWKQKLVDAKRGGVDSSLMQARHGQPTLHESVAQKGVEHPVSLTSERSVYSGRRMIAGGHTRLAAATDVAPDRLVPVQHFATADSAVRHEYRRDLGR